MARRKAPSKNGEKTADGKFAPGNRLGKGRPEGSRNKATIAAQELMDGEAEALTKKAIELAKGGDMAALRLCLDRIVPPRKDRPISLDIGQVKDITDMTHLTGAIVEAVADSAMTPSEGQAFAGILETHRKIVELADIEQRVRALEGKKGAA